MLEEGHPASAPADGHPCLCLWLRGAVGLHPPGGLSLHRTCFLFVAGLSPGPAVPRAGDGEEPLAAWSAGDAAAPGSRCGICLWAGGWGVPVHTQGSAPERVGPAPHSLGDASPHWDGAGLQITHGALRGSRGLSLPLLCTIFTFFWVQTEARLLGLWLPGSGTGGSCSSARHDAGDPSTCWSSDAFAGVRAVPCRQSQALCRPGPPKPLLCWRPPEKCLFFVVVETQRQQGLLSGAVGARDLGLPRACRTPTPRMSVVSS